jgi:hypothetical protein
LPRHHSGFGGSRAHCPGHGPTLYEAVALGLKSLAGEDWVSGIADGLNVARVSVTNVPIEHCVTFNDFNKWLVKEGGSPREVSARYRIREILGVPHKKAI